MGLPVALVIDAKSVFDSATATEAHCGTARDMHTHVRALRQMLDVGQIKHLVWCDTRDMLADALNKGSVSRAPLNTALQTGRWHIKHPTLVWSTLPQSRNKAVDSMRVAVHDFSLSEEGEVVPRAGFVFPRYRQGNAGPPRSVMPGASTY